MTFFPSHECQLRLKLPFSLFPKSAEEFTRQYLAVGRCYDRVSLVAGSMGDMHDRSIGRSLDEARADVSK